MSKNRSFLTIWKERATNICTDFSFRIVLSSPESKMQEASGRQNVIIFDCLNRITRCPSASLQGSAAYFPAKQQGSSQLTMPAMLPSLISSNLWHRSTTCRLERLYQSYLSLRVLLCVCLFPFLYHFPVG